MMMFRRISEVKQAKCVTNYRIYKELNLNLRNVNVFFKNEDTSKSELGYGKKNISVRK